MSATSEKEPCPFCGELISRTAERCRFCGEDLYEDEERDRRRPRRRSRNQDQIEATDFIIPTNVSGWAIASCYLGLIGFCLPVIGLVFAVPAVICGIVAFKNWSNKGSYGAVTGNIRAFIGLVLGSLAIVGWGTLGVVILLHGFR